MSTRLNALSNPAALMKKPMSKEDYFNAPMISDPHCLFDFCLETDGAVAAVVTSAERAKDLKQKPAYIMASTHGGFDQVDSVTFVLTMTGRARGPMRTEEVLPVIEPSFNPDRRPR